MQGFFFLGGWRGGGGGGRGGGGAGVRFFIYRRKVVRANKQEARPLDGWGNVAKIQCLGSDFKIQGCSGLNAYIFICPTLYLYTYAYIFLLWPCALYECALRRQLKLRTPDLPRYFFHNGSVALESLKQVDGVGKTSGSKLQSSRGIAYLFSCRW